MEHYAVHHLKGATDLVIVLQYPGLETSGLVIVAPLVSADELPEIHPITPVVTIGDRDWMVLTYRMAAISVSDLGEAITVIERADYLFHRALSRLFYGN